MAKNRHNMKIIFFEVQDWEQDHLKQAFPNATLTQDKLNSTTVESYATEIASCFIYSSISKEVIDKLPNLKFIATRSTGFDHIDIAYCKSKNIKVVNVPEYGSNTVAEHTFALILSLTRKIYQSVNQSKNLNFEHDQIRGIDLYGKTLGIVGLGKIGINVLRIAKGFGMKVLGHTRTQDPTLQDKFDFKYTHLDSLIQNSDIVTLHLSLTDQTRHIINRENIVKFKKGSCLINTARGGLIETEAIVLGLEKDILSGVGLDVLEEEKELSEEAAILTSDYRKDLDLETLVYNHILINHPKVLITPHNAFNSVETLSRITDTTIENIKTYLNGEIRNLHIVSDTVGKE